MFKRYYSEKLLDLLEPNKVLVLYGPRRVGKTTLIEEFIKGYNGKVFLGFGDDAKTKDILKTQEIEKIRNYFGGYHVIIIDEAQKIPDIGLSLKLIVDHLPNIKVIATGSSSFDLANKIGEPLTGRQRIIRLFPLSSMELKEQFGAVDAEKRLDDLLIYGSYPELLLKANYNNKMEYLSSLRDSYLYKDILELENLRNSDKIADLLRLIGFQIGNEVSLNELGNALDLSKQTVEKYLDLLEKAFVIIKVRGFSRNLRKEISKTARYYFWDNGVRNSIINNFNSLAARNDVGQLWENFLFIERFKKRSYQNILSNVYFWRTYDQKEVDLVEEREGKLFGYEFKWGDKKARKPKLWLQTYTNATYEVINRDNYLGFIA
ncbi:ATP-binding protein [Candidatus Saganbacteria bacterium]|nr:ATP-binding protein [Candidatus Saganbacteria bacterium]